MPSREFTLAVPQALEAAYLILIGQITLLFAKILFEAGDILLNSASFNAPKLETVFIVSVSMLVPLILIINILSCWASTRATFAEFNEYPNNLFLVDLIHIILFFTLNNIVSFAASPPSDTDYLVTLMKPITIPASSLEARITQIVPPFIYAIGAIITWTYAKWNNIHARERARLLSNATTTTNPHMLSHNNFLYFSTFLQVILAAITITSDQTIVEYVCLLFWVAVWVWLNTTWILQSPLSP